MTTRFTIPVRPAPLAVILLLLFVAACRGGDSVPDPGSDAYQQAVTAFYTSVAAIQAGSDLGADENLQKVTELAPGEPAAWANLGLLALRRNELDKARERLQRAAEIAPQNSAIQLLFARLEATEGNYDQAVQHLQKAIELDPENVKAKYALAQEIEREAGTGWEARVQRLLGEMVSRHPDNLALLLESVRLAARQGDRDLLTQRIAQIDSLGTDWPPEVTAQLDALHAAAASGDMDRTATQSIFLRNALLRLPGFRQDIDAIQTPTQQVGDLITHFLRMQQPETTVAEADLQLSFTPEEVRGAAAGPWTGAAAVWLTGEGDPIPAATSGRALLVGDEPLPLPDGIRFIAPLDYDYDFKTDLAVAGPGGFRLFKQTENGAFEDATSSVRLPASVAGGSYTSIWAADVDLEGDIDLVLGTQNAPPVVLRNNIGEVFEPIHPFDAVNGLRSFAWADLDGDGDPDAALIDGAGGLHVIVNDRNGIFHPQALPQEVRQARALTVGDLASNGSLDLVVLSDNGAVYALSADPTSANWSVSEPARFQGEVPEQARIFTADLDNNGSLDVVATAPGTTQIWMGDVGKLTPLGANLTAYVQDVADFDGNGRLDLLGLSTDGGLVRLVNRGTKDYHWQALRPRASLSVGDQRINSFGIGGDVEIRSGLFYQQQPITSPVVHFGLGNKDHAEVARIVWPNGDVQAEFDLQANQVVFTPQRLKGSCPWVFTWDGKQMRFVTDFLWRSPLGLRINAQATAGVAATGDWIKIPGDLLKPKDGLYDIRITAELWETHYFDHVSLLVVDHPAAVDAYVDERFVVPPPKLALQVTDPPTPVLAAWDEHGQDVTGLVRRKDARYLGTFGHTKYQGIATDHYVEVELPDTLPQQGLRLLAFGWIRPTDSSINVAISQGEGVTPKSLSLEVPDGRGGWRTAKDNLGFPAGKLKTILLDLDGVFTPGIPHRLRLRTNMEVYWDFLGWTTLRPNVTVDTLHLSPKVADLRYHGFSRLAARDRISPALPDYETLVGTAPHWRDLVGYYTRFGDVRELLQKVDDRYVIMNAGDELRFRFPEAPPVKEGWVRDFILIGDGWEKDGDYNTMFSTTVLPLPTHADPSYDTPPTTLENDPVYRQHAEDWQTYHTRYVGPEPFRDALVTQK